MGKPEGRRPLGRWEVNIKMIFEKLEGGLRLDRSGSG